MPVSVAVCETANVVNSALRESLGVNVNVVNGSGGGGGCAAATVNRGTTADEARTRAGINGNGNSNADDDDDDDDCDNLESQFAASAKRVLLGKIEFEEVDNYRDSMLDKLKSKYIVIKPTSSSNNNNSNNNIGSNGSKITSVNGHDNNTNANGARAGSANNRQQLDQEQQQSTQQQQQQGQQQSQQGQQTNSFCELPKPKRVLYPRENIRIGWKQSERKWQVGMGFVNVGNTCYLNSTLQALFHIPSLAEWLMSESSHVENCNIPEAGGFCTICAMAKTLHATQTSSSSVRPYHIYSKLKQICKHMVVGRQEDAHEFLRFLVDAMEKAYLMRFRNYKELDQLVKETTPLNQIFGGYLRSTVRCLSCNHVSITFQHFQDILLDIRRADSLDDAFDTHFARERLEDMGYKCEGCKKKVSATKQFSLERAPITLCIQLKRFSMVGNKLSKQIPFKTRIDLSKYASRSPVAAAQPLCYRLVSMITHLGVSQHCGHYTAIGLTESSGYCMFDDSSVRPVNLPSICTTNAYIMFYELDVPNGPPRNMTQSPGVASSNNSGKINGLRLNNGQHNAATPITTTAGAGATTVTSVSAPTTPARFIGPQLPPGGLNNGYLPSPGATTSFNGQLNQKITIHLKTSANSLVKQTTPNGSTQQAQSIQIAGQQSNGIGLTGASLVKFQENAAKLGVVGAAHKTEGVAITNGNSHNNSNNKSSSNANASQNIYSSHFYLPMSSDDDDEHDTNNDKKNGRNDVERRGPGSKVNVNATTQLPSMPKLFNVTTTPGPTSVNTKATLKPPLRSLVPYESASEEEEQQQQPLPPAIAAKRYEGNIILKRRNDSGCETSEDDDEQEEEHQKPEVQLQQPQQQLEKEKKNVNKNIKPNALLSLPSSSCLMNVNSSKQKTDAIDEIFRSLNNFKNKHKTSASPLSTAAITPTTPPAKSDSDDGECEQEEPKTKPTAALTNGWRSHKQQQQHQQQSQSTNKSPSSPKTPPSPAVIKSKTGIWEITRSDGIEDDVNQSEKTEVNGIISPITASKAHKNPFSVNKSTSQDGCTINKRPKLHNGNFKGQQGNGYQSEAVCNSNGNGNSNGTDPVNELLKQSHRGFGNNVLSWNGKATELDKELQTESREQRKRELEDDDENEMDRGRQRKVKSMGAKSANTNSTPGYNPFQEYENQKRWHKTSNNSGSSYTRFNNSYRQGFQQRNKFKFNRFGGPGSAKFQQQRALQRHLAAGGGFTRRQQHHSSQQQQQQQQSS